jgi:GNAT superfamily N-acetyltransferase
MKDLLPALVAVLRRILRRHWILTFDLPVPPHGSPAPSPPSGVTIRRGTPQDAIALGLHLDQREPPEERWLRGDLALVAELADRPVGCQWIAAGPFRRWFLPSVVEPRPQERYLYGLYVLPEAQRRGIGSALLRAGLLEARHVGATVCFADINGWNRGSIALHAALGATLREELRGLIVLDRFVIPLWRRRWKP